MLGLAKPQSEQKKSFKLWEATPVIFQLAMRSITITTSMEHSVLLQSELSVQSNFVPSVQDLSSISMMGSIKLPTPSTDGSFGPDIISTRNKFSDL